MQEGLRYDSRGRVLGETPQSLVDRLERASVDVALSTPKLGTTMGLGLRIS